MSEDLQLSLLDELDPRTHARTEDPATSHAAAARLSSKRTMMRKLLGVFSTHAVGLTAEQVVTIAGYGPADGAWKRVSDLLNAGLLEDTGQTRVASSGRSQRVLRITEAGRRAL